MSRLLQLPYRITFRLTAEELAQLNKRRGSFGLSAYIRAAALGATLPKIPRRRLMSAFEAAKIRHAAYHGNNLNQIARAANRALRTSPNGGAATLAEILFSLLSLERAFSAFLNTGEQKKDSEQEVAK